MKKKILYCLILLLTALGPSRSEANPIQENFEEGQKAYQQGNYKKAVQSYEKVVEADSNFAPVYNALGLAYHAQKEDLSDTMWFFKVAVDIDPNYIEAHENMCKIYYQAGKHDEAEKACLDALSINPSLATAQLSLAWLYLAGKSQPADAIYYFNEILEKVKNPMLYFGRGMAYSLNGNTADVLDTVTILRGMGEEGLAVQLEKSLRTGENPFAPPEKKSVPERQPGQLIKAVPPAVVDKPASSSEPGGSAGKMRIRLRGRMITNVGIDSEKPHPGSLKQGTEP